MESYRNRQKNRYAMMNSNASSSAPNSPVRGSRRGGGCDKKENGGLRSMMTTSSSMSQLALRNSFTNTNLNMGRVQQDGLWYHTGFDNSFQSECLPGALPVGRNTPRNVPYNLYTEQLSGTAFTAPRATNRRTWLYRVQPAVVTGRAEPVVLGASNGKQVYFGHVNPADCLPEINPLRWQPMTMNMSARGSEMAKAKANATAGEEQSHTATSAGDTSGSSTQDHKKIDFVRGTHLQCTSANNAGGSRGGEAAGSKFGLSIYQYCFNDDMTDTSLMNADGEVCIVPQHGSIYIRTELGCLVVHPKELAVIPAGMVHQVQVYRGQQGDNGDQEPEGGGRVPGGGGQQGQDTAEQQEELFCRGYVLEIYSKGGGFALPTLGPIGANGLANARDFLVPVADVAAATQQEYERPHTIYTKSHGGLLWKRTQSYTPYNVVAWHGNYTPYKYILERFCAVNSVSYDHLDPSIYTVLTCQSETEGTALADVVIFPPRWQATDEDTFRPPYYHRNCMSEYMGLITGKYDAKVGEYNNSGEKKKRGFVPGGSSLHPVMTPHGPDAASYQQAVADPCAEPSHLEGGLAFMFETALPLCVAPEALHDRDWREMDYANCWQGLTAEHFTGWDLLEQQREEELELQRAAAREQQELDEEEESEEPLDTSLV